MDISRAITHVEFLANAIIVHFHLQKPYGVPDEKVTITFNFKSLPELYQKIDALMPAHPPYANMGRDGFTWGEEIPISDCRKTLVLVFESFCESDRGPNEHIFVGSFRKEV